MGKMNNFQREIKLRQQRQQKYLIGHDGETITIPLLPVIHGEFREIVVDIRDNQI